MAGFVVDAPPATLARSSGFFVGEAPGATPVDTRRAKDFADSVLAGLQASSAGLAARGKMPGILPDEDAPWYHRLGYGVGQVVGDIPAGIVGAIPGSMAGAAVSGPAAPIGAAVGGFSGAFAAPMALREALIEAYNGNHALSWSGVWEITKAALKGGAKGAAIGAATGGAGAVAGRVAGGMIAPSVGTTVSARGAVGAIETSAFGAELATLVSTSAALEGHMPTWQDFMDNAILLGGMKGAVAVAKKMRNNYAETGKRPEEQLADAARDPVLAAELQGELPPPAEGHVRIYRGETAPRTLQSATEAATFEPPEFRGRWWTTDRTTAERYTTSPTDPRGKLLYMDLPAEQVEALRVFKNPEARKYSLDGREIVVPPEMLPRAREVGSPVPSAYAPLALNERIQAALAHDPRPEQIAAFLTDKQQPLKLGEPPVENVVRLEYITDAETYKGVLRLITERYGTEIEKQRRGVVSNAQTLNEAKDMLIGGKLGPHEVGAAANAAESAARLAILRAATHDAYAKVTAIADIAPGDLTPVKKLEALASLEKLAALKAEADGMLAEWGRAGQMVRQIKRDPAMLADAESMLKLVERKGNLQDIAAMVRQMKDGAQLAAFADKYVKATTMEKVIEAWKAGILSGPQTHLANIFGNLVKWGVEVPESVLSASLFAAGKAIKGEPLKMAQWKARAFAPLYGLQHGAREALFVASEVWKGHGERLEKADVYRHAIEGKTGEVVRVPFKLLQVEDALFRTVAERAEAYKMAVDRVVKEGFHPETAEARQRIVQYTADPAFGLAEKAGAEAVARVQEAGAEAVFAQRLGPHMEMAQRAMAGTAMNFVIPFVRTPANLVSWAMQHAPGLNLLSSRWRADFAAGGEAQARALARVVIGTGLAMTAYELAKDGLLTGGGLFDKEQLRTKTAAGWQPYSVKIGDKYYSFQRIEPVAKVLGLAADLVDLSQSKKLDEGDRAKAASMLVLMFGNAAISTTYLSGLANAMQSLIDPERYGENFIEQYASSTVPKIVGQSVTMADPYKREVEGTLDAIQSQLPFLREKLLPKRDAWGQPKANERWFAVMPVATSQASQDLVRTEAARLAVAIADAPKYAQEKGPFNPRDERVKLTPEQRDIFREVSGTKAMELLAPIVNAPDWSQIPHFAQAAIYRHVIDNTRKQGMYAALPPDAAAREQLRMKIIDRVIRETQQAQGTP